MRRAKDHEIKKIIRTIFQVNGEQLLLRISEELNKIL